MKDSLFVGIRGSVVCIQKRDGKELWRRKLKGNELTTLLVEDNAVFAATRGRLYSLSVTTGAILWQNDLPQLGYGASILAADGHAAIHAAVHAAQTAADEAAAAAAAAGAASSS